MKLTTVTLSIGQNINTGNYNQARYDISGTIELLEGDEHEQIEELKTLLREQARSIKDRITGHVSP